MQSIDIYITVFNIALMCVLALKAIEVRRQQKQLQAGLDESLRRFQAMPPQF